MFHYIEENDQRIAMVDDKLTKSEIEELLEGDDFVVLLGVSDILVNRIGIDNTRSLELNSAEPTESENEVLSLIVGNETEEAYGVKDIMAVGEQNGGKILKVAVERY